MTIDDINYIVCASYFVFHILHVAMTRAYDDDQGQLQYPTFDLYCMFTCSAANLYQVESVS